MYHKCQFHISSVVKPVCRPRSKYLIFKRTTSARPAAGLLDCVLLRIAANNRPLWIFKPFSDLKMLSHWSHLKSFPAGTFSNTHTLVKRVGVWSRMEANRRPLCPILFSKCHHYHSKIPITSQCVQFYSPLSPIPTAWDPIISDNQVVWSLAALEREPFGKKRSQMI